MPCFDRRAQEVTALLTFFMAFSKGELGNTSLLSAELKRQAATSHCAYQAKQGHKAETTATYGCSSTYHQEHIFILLSNTCRGGGKKLSLLSSKGKEEVGASLNQAHISLEQTQSAYGKQRTRQKHQQKIPTTFKSNLKLEEARKGNFSLLSHIVFKANLPLLLPQDATTSGKSRLQNLSIWSRSILFFMFTPKVLKDSDSLF